MLKIPIPRIAYWWLIGHFIVLAIWLLIAWAIWPWPNYGYCDFPVSSWRFLFAATPVLIFFCHVPLSFLLLGYAVLRGKKLNFFVILFTAAIWFLLARYDFNPTAIPGDGCYEGIEISAKEEPA